MSRSSGVAAGRGRGGGAPGAPDSDGAAEGAYSAATPVLTLDSSAVSVVPVSVVQPAVQPGTTDLTELLPDIERDLMAVADDGIIGDSALTADSVESADRALRKDHLDL